jgi:hypothetical protein
MKAKTAAALVLALSAVASAQKPEQLLGTWRGTSTCTDRVAAPACNDETVVYEFTPGAKPGVIRWVADKIVDGKRDSMGELELSWDAAESCWKSVFESPRMKSVWKLSVDGTHLTGTLQQVPGNQTTRKIDAKREH